MKIDLPNTRQNYRFVGEVTEGWITRRIPEPRSANELLNQLIAHGVTNPSVSGPPQRPVHFVHCHNDINKPLILTLPSEERLHRARRNNPGEYYPLPEFYNDLFDGPRRVLSADEFNEIRIMRLAETIMRTGSGDP